VPASPLAFTDGSRLKSSRQEALQVTSTDRLVSGL